MLGVALTTSSALRGDLFQTAQIVGGKVYAEGCDVFFQILAALRAGNGNDIVALRQQPGKSELPRSTFLFLRYKLDSSDEIEILLKIFALETRRKSAIVVGSKIVETS